MRSSLAVTISALSLCLQLAGQTVGTAPQDRFTGPIDETARVTLTGNVHPLVRGKAGVETDSSLPMQHMVLTLKASTEQRAALEQLVQQQHDPTSPLYHHFLSPQGFGSKFGVSDTDIAKVTSWLTSHGFTIDEIPAGRQSIVFSGTSEDVKSAFNTQIKKYAVSGVTHFANDNDPTIPAALAGVVNGVVKLHNFQHSPKLTSVRSLGAINSPNPEFTYGGSHYLAPADYGVIYDINPLYSAGITGTGQSIAIAARSNINLSDMQLFRSQFGLVSNTPTITIANSDPGVLEGDSVETTLDTEWSGAVAPNAKVNVVVAASTNTADGIDLSVQYIVNHNVAPVMSLSYGSCEADMGSSELAFYNNLWQQAASQGMTVFVSAGDSGAAGCYSGGSSSGSGQAINGLCSSPYSVCVGGTEFNDTTNPGQYWLPGNNAAQGSAQSYIPEVVWNESGNVSGGSGLWAGGGGASIVYTKPSWQTGPGVPADGKRDVPDVSLDAAGHDGYLIVYYGGLYSVGGTSASSPSFAGLMALVNQKTASTQGNANPNFYALATKQANGGTAIFHDIITGNNSVPGVTGFTAVAGYDQASGLGSVDANLLVNHWTDTTSTTPTLTVQASQPAVNGQLGQSSQLTLKTSVNGTFNSAVTLSVSGAPTGVTLTLGSTNIAAPGSGSVNLTIAVAQTAAYGTYPLTVTAKGGNLTSTATVTLTLQSAGSFKLASNSNYFSLGQTNSGTLPVTLTAQSGFNSVVTLSMAGLPAGVTAAFSPASVTPTSAGAASSLTLTVAKTAVTGVYPVNLVAAGGGQSQTWPIQLTVTAPSGCTLASSPSSLSLVAGNSANLQITCGNVQGGFKNSLSLTVGTPPSGTIAQVLTNYVVPGGAGSTIAISSYNTATPGTFSLSVNASEASSGFNQTIAIPFTITAPNTLLVEPSQNSINVQQGGSSTMTVAFVPSGTFKSAVTLGIAGASSGISASFSTSTIASPGSGTPTLTISASPNVAAGSSYIVVYATEGGQIFAAPVGIVVTAAPNFKLTASGSTSPVQQGATAAAGTVAISGFTSGFNSSVALSAHGLPTGLTGSFSPAALSASGSSSVFTVTAASSLAPGVYPITVSGTGGVITNTAALSVAVTAAPNFKLSSTAATAALIQGATDSAASVMISGFTNGFNSPVTLTASGLPTGVSGKFSTATLSGSGSSATYSLTASSSATPGVYPITVLGTGGGVTNTTSLSITVTAPPNFKLSSSTTTASLVQGATANAATITISGFTNGFNSPVALTASGLPTGLTGSFSTATLSGSGSSATYSLTASSSVAPGVYPITVTGTGGGVANAATLSATVTAAPNFKLSSAATTASLVQGGTASAANVSISNFTNGFSSPVALTASGLPTGLTGKFSSTTLTGSGSSTTYSLTASSTVVTGTYQIILTGTGGGVTNTATLPITVTAPPNFKLSSTATTTSLVQGATASAATVSISSFTNGFNSPVALMASGLPTGLTGKFSSTTLTGSGSSTTYSLMASSTVVTGTYQIILTGTGGGVTNTATLPITVTAPPNFKLSSSATEASLVQGAATSASTVSISSFTNGFNSPVALTTSGLPAGLTGKFSSTTLTGSGSGATYSLTASSSVTPGVYPITVTGTGGGVTNTATLSITVTAPPNFKLSSSAVASPLVQGTTATAAIFTLSNFTNGFNSSVLLAASGLPTGLTGKFSASTLIGSGSSATYSLTAASSVTPGVYPITVSGTGGGITNTATLSITVTASPNFKLSSSATTAPLVQGTTGSAGTVSISTFTNGFNSSVALSASGLPTGLTGMFSPSTLTASGSSAAYSVTVAGSVTPGVYPITISATGGGITNTTTLSITITAPPNFKLSSTATTTSLGQGATASAATVSISSFTNGFNSPVALTASGLPTGLTGAFSTATLTGSGSSATYSLTASSSVTPGVYPITVTGTGGGVTNTATLSITVTAAPNFKLSSSTASSQGATANATTASLQQGTSVSIATLSISTFTNGFNSPVTLSLGALPAGVTGKFSAATLSGSGTSSTLTLTAGSSVAASTYQVTVAATGGGVTNTASISFTVTAAPNFKLTSSATAATLQQGATSSVATLTISGFTNGFNSSVALSASGLPAGVTGKFSVATLSGSGASASYSLTAASSLAPGVYPITLTGTAAGITNTASLSLTVTAVSAAIKP